MKIGGDKLATPATTDNGSRNSGTWSNYLDLREELTRDSRFNFETGAWETPWGEFKNGVSVEWLRKNSQHTKVNPPYGEERLKAVATLGRDFPVNLSLNSRDGFHVIKPETSRGMREIEALANFFSSKQNSDWSQDYLKIFIHKKNNIFSRGQRTIPSMSEIFGNK